MFRAAAGAVARSLKQSQAQRAFSAAAAAAAADSDKVKIPAAVFGPAGKYASALYVAGLRSKSLDAVETELSQLSTAAVSSRAFSLFLRDPGVDNHTRIKAIEEILGEAGFSPITKNLLAVLSDNGRLGDLPKINSAYSDIMMAHRGHVKATVTSALELAPDELAELTDALGSFLEPGQTLKLTQKVDRSIIGGLTVDIGEKHIDLSIRSRVKQLENVLLESM